MTHTVGKFLKVVSLNVNTGNLPLNAELCAMKSVVVSRVDWWRTFLSNCEQIHNNLSKLNCRNHIAEDCVLGMIRGLRQALTRIGCLRLNLDRQWRTHANDDHLYHDDVTSASLPSSKICEEAVHLEIECMKEMNLYSPCEHEAVKERTR